MNPNHLTPNVRKKVIEAVLAQRQMMREKKSKGIEKAFENDEEINSFFNPFYEKVKDEVDNKLGAFLELCILEFKYGVVSGYLGASTLNKDGNTTVKIE